MYIKFCFARAPWEGLGMKKSNGAHGAHVALGAPGPVEHGRFPPPVKAARARSCSTGSGAPRDPHLWMFEKTDRPLPVFWVPGEPSEAVGWFLASRFSDFWNIFCILGGEPKVRSGRCRRRFFLFCVRHVCICFDVFRDDWPCIVICSDC